MTSVPLNVCDQKQSDLIFKPCGRRERINLSRTMDNLIYFYIFEHFIHRTGALPLHLSRWTQSKGPFIKGFIKLF